MINAMKSKGLTYCEFKGIANDAVKKILDFEWNEHTQHIEK
jgi:hypothetical protein